MAVIGEILGVTRTRDHFCWGQSLETPRVLGPSNRRTHSDDQGIEKNPRKDYTEFRHIEFQDSEARGVEFHGRCNSQNHKR
jgi:hypothetical protein